MSAEAFKCHTACESPSTAPAPYKLQTTELVVINSSPRGVGPHARVLKRRSNHYLLPRSPESPTLQMQKRRKAARLGLEVSGNFRARRATQYVTTEVNELKVEPLQVAQTCLLPRPGSATPTTSTRSWSPTFPSESEAQVKRINLQRAPTFDPSDKHTSSFSQLLSLDLLPALGLGEDDFWKLFSKCKVCNNFMTTRTIPYHICPGNEIECRFGTDIVPRTLFLRLLDVHNTDREAGVPEDIFRAIFYTCKQCGRYMTERVSFNHTEEADSDTEDQGHAICIYSRELRAGSSLNALKNGNFQQVRSLEKIPALELL